MSERKPEAMFEQVALIGIGLIGSSISHAMRRKGLARRVTGSARTSATLDTAKQLRLIDQGFDSAADAVKGADLVILSVPVGACGPLAADIAPHLKQGAILTDVGSVKAAVVRDMAPHVPEGVHFVPGHPIAGTEQSGPEAGFAELFDGRWTILTPTPDTDKAAVAKLKAFWTALGSKVEIMSAEHHDMVLAVTSHLPHLIAYNIVNTAEHLERVTEKEVIKFSAGGFRDFTRIAASDPTMWRDVFLNNKQAVMEMLRRFSEDLEELSSAIESADGDTLFRRFAEARSIRRGIIAAGQDTPAPDFGRAHAAGATGTSENDKSE
jgi:cyclohexadieny/prephenate dehydrogenase